MYLIDRVGRKFLLITSGIGMGCFHAVTAWSFYNNNILQNRHFITEGQNSTLEAYHENITVLHSLAQPENELENDGTRTTYLPLIGIVGFYLMFAIGTGAVPMVVLGEMFPQSVKGNAISAINSSMWLLNFGMSKMFFIVCDAIGIYGMFLFFSVSSIVMSIYVFIFLPETKNKTLNQIQRKVEGKSKAISNLYT